VIYKRKKIVRSNKKSYTQKKRSNKKGDTLFVICHE
jgi:hypothetical protein